jgi:histidinol phosphatase-like PHP family hydrolase
MNSDEFRALLEEPYLFHLHTNYTDGKLSVTDYFQFAVKKKIRSLFFTEHVREKLDYDFSAFAKEISEAQELYGVRGVLGAEAKLLPGGGLDINPLCESMVEVICIACHSFPNDLDLYYNSLSSLFGNPIWFEKIRVYVHPARFLHRRKLQTEENLLKDQLSLADASRKGVFVEVNRREVYPPGYFDSVPHSMKVVGYDVHDNLQLERWVYRET